MTDRTRNGARDCAPDHGIPLPGMDIDPDGLSDGELIGLFSAFDAVTATDDLKARTLAHIAQAQPGSADNTDSASEAPSAPAAIARPGGKTPARGRAKLRAIRIGAIAACLALALTGGVAYATPTAHVQVSAGDTSVDLGVNRFGITVSADADDDDGRRVIEAAAPYNIPFDESLEHVMDAMEGQIPDEQIGIDVQSGDDAQRERLQGEGDQIVQRRQPEAGPAPAQPDGAQPDGAQPEGQPEGQLGAQPGQQPGQQPGGQPGQQPNAGAGDGAGYGDDGQPQAPLGGQPADGRVGLGGSAGANGQAAPTGQQSQGAGPSR